MNNLKIFAERLKYLRTEKELTTRELAEKTGLSNGSITAWEKGRFEPKISSAIALAIFFDVTIDYLFGLEND